MQSKMLKLNLYEHHQFLIENIKRTSHHPSIALLAFADQDEESRRRQSGRWLIDDVAHHLSRFRYLSLAGRRASDMMHQRHATLDAVGQALRTRYLATGSVLWTTDNFHAMVRLIDSASGKQLWVSHYRMGRDRAADVEDDLAKEMATGLAVSIDALERSRLDQHDDTDDGFESATPLTLMAEHLTRQFQQRANERARQLALKACRVDPMSARGHAVLSRTHHLDGRYAWTSDPKRSIERAVEFAERAIQLDPLEAWGHAEIGMNGHIQRNYEKAHAAYRRALDINPNDPDILADFSHFLISDGEAEQAIELLGMAIHLRPDRAAMYRYYLACAFNILGEDEMVVSLLSKSGDNHEGHRLLAASYARLGMPDQSAHHAELAMKAHPNFSLAHWRTVLPHRDPAIRARIIEGLERAGLH